MFRIDDATSVSSLPAPASPGTEGFFTGGDPLVGSPPTNLTAEWFNSVQEELVTFLTLAGITHSKTTNNQVASAIISGALTYALDTGSANAYVASLPLGPVSLANSLSVRIKIANTNTGPSTLNLNSGGAKTIYNNGVALVGGELVVGETVAFDYDTTLVGWKIRRIAARKLLAADTTYYVTTSGNDTTGTGAVGAPWLTIMKAINYIQQNVDLGGHTATINVGAGTYTASVQFNPALFVGGNVTISGDTTTPSNCIISTTNADCFVVSGTGVVSIQGFKLQTTTGGNGINSDGGAVVKITGKMDYGACATSHLLAENGGRIIISANYTISGGSASHWFFYNAGSIQCSSQTITLTGTPAFSGAFATGNVSGTAQVFSNTFSGSATGPRYGLGSNAVVNVQGAGASYLPGNSAGSTATGAQYT